MASPDLTIQAQTRPGRWPAGRVLLLVVLVNLVLGGLLFALRPPWLQPVEPGMVPAMPPQVRELQARLAAGEHGEPYQLSLSDDELTALAAASLAARKEVPFSRVRVAIRGDLVVADAVTQGLAVTVPVRAVGSVSASGGLPVARLEDVSLGDVVLPEFVRHRILQDANSSLDFSRYNLPVTVESLELRSDAMVISGRLK